MKIKLSKAFWKYYWEINRYSILLALLIGPFAGVVSSLIIFCSIGIFVGFILFHYLQKHEYYLYYNLGWTKLRLVALVWGINVLVACSLSLLIVCFLFVDGYLTN